MKTRIVVWEGRAAYTPLEVEVRDFKSFLPCPTCDRDGPASFDTQAEAAFQDGQEFAEMLIAVGSSEYIRGLMHALSLAGK